MNTKTEKLIVDTIEELLIRALAVGMVWFYAWLCNPDIDSGMVWFLGLIYSGILVALTGTERRLKGRR